MRTTPTRQTTTVRGSWILTAVAAGGLLIAGCGSDASTESAASPSTVSAAETTGVRLVSAQEGARIQAAPPSNLVILDVRAPEEFAEGHLEGADLINFYDDDFTDQIGGLDRDVPYLLYCRSGNRSGQTRALMAELGFSDVADVDGGILAWSDAGLPTSAP